MNHHHRSHHYNHRRAVEHSRHDGNNPVPVNGQGIKTLDHQDVAAHAYALWAGRGRPSGSPEVDWFQAVHDLRNGAVPRENVRESPESSEFNYG